MIVCACVYIIYIKKLMKNKLLRNIPNNLASFDESLWYTQQSHWHPTWQRKEDPQYQVDLLFSLPGSIDGWLDLVLASEAI